MPEHTVAATYALTMAIYLFLLGSALTNIPKRSDWTDNRKLGALLAVFFLPVVGVLWYIATELMYVRKHHRSPLISQDWEHFLGFLGTLGRSGFVRTFYVFLQHGCRLGGISLVLYLVVVSIVVAFVDTDVPCHFFGRWYNLNWR